MFCKYCGESNKPNDTYCRNCGKVLTETHPIQRDKGTSSNPSNQNHKIKRPFWKIVFTISAVAFLIADILLAINVIPAYNARQMGTRAIQNTMNQTAGLQGQLKLGETNLQTSQTVEPTGGDIRIDDDGSTIDGFSIRVPAGAYDQPQSFEISTTKIKGHSYGDAFDPITPLISIDNSEVFANEPLLVTVPISKTDDEFAMGFYYDEETGALEAIPFVSQSNDEIILLTSHFSAVVVTKTLIASRGTVGDVDSGFVVGIDDMQIPNNGSIAAPQGFCGGQTLAMLYYYSRRERIGYDQPLYGRFDNNGLGDTPDLCEDDANLFRLCSVLQLKNNMGGASGYFQEFGYNDEWTFQAFAYALEVTGHPQLIGIYYADPQTGKPMGHALLVYAIEENRLLVADPNFPGQYKWIELVQKANGAWEFKPYVSGSNAKEASQGAKAYDKFCFLGDFAIVDEATLGHYWSMLMDGEDPGAAVFPQEQVIDVATYKDADGWTTYTQIKDGVTLSAAGTATLGADSKGLLVLQKTDPNSRVTVYFADEKKGTVGTNWTGVAKLQIGDNDIGILYELLDSNNEYEFQNFVRYNVVYEDGGVAPTLEPTMEPTIEPTIEPTPEPSNDYDGREIIFLDDYEMYPDQVAAEEDLTTYDIVVGEWISTDGSGWTLTFYEDGTGLFDNGTLYGFNYVVTKPNYTDVECYFVHTSGWGNGMELFDDGELGFGSFSNSSIKFYVRK